MFAGGIDPRLNHRRRNLDIKSGRASPANLRSGRGIYWLGVLCQGYNPPKRGILPPETKNLAFPTFTRALTTIEENAVLANHTAVYVYGEIDYLDVLVRGTSRSFASVVTGRATPSECLRQTAKVTRPHKSIAHQSSTG
jgi:hypothetical protein